MGFFQKAKETAQFAAGTFRADIERTGLIRKKKKKIPLKKRIREKFKPLTKEQQEKLLKQRAVQVSGLIKKKSPLKRIKYKKKTPKQIRKKAFSQKIDTSKLY